MKKPTVKMSRGLARAFGVLAGKFRRGEISVAEWKAGLDRLDREYPDGDDRRQKRAIMERV